MLEDLREIYGEIFVTSLPDGIDVPWKPLSYGDFIYYSDLLQEGRISRTLIEDEIFKKCVVNKALVDRISTSKAGTISTVVDHIIKMSGPNTIDEFNSYMDVVRQKAQSPLNQIITLICKAFPAYKPDDLYKMDAQVVLLRLAQAEAVLLEAGLLKEPIKLYKEGEPAPARRKEPAPELKAAWEKSMQFKDLNPPAQASVPAKSTTPKKVEPLTQATTRPISPAFEKRVNIKPLLIESLQGQDAGDLSDDDRLKQRLLGDIPNIYSSLISQLKKEQEAKKK